MAEGTSGGSTWQTLATQFSVIVTVLSAYCYLLGIAYLYGYYGFFGLALESIDVPFWWPMIHSLAALTNQLMPPVAGLYVAYISIPLFREAGLATLAGRFPVMSRLIDLISKADPVVVRFAVRIAWLLPPAILLKLVVDTHSQGRADGAREFQNPSERAFIEMRRAEAETSPELVNESKEAKLRLLLQTKDLVVLFVAPNRADERPQTLFLARSSLAALKTHALR